MNETFERYVTKRGKKGFAGFLLSVLKIITLTAFLFIFISSFLLTSYRVDSSSMKPTLDVGDRILSTPLLFGPKIPLTTHRFPGFRKPERGDLVVVIPPYCDRDIFLMHVVDPIASLFTRTEGSVLESGDFRKLDRLMVKRILGIPGDKVKMEDFILYIHPPGSVGFYREQELIPVDYGINVEFTPKGWTDDLPFSGNMEEIVLKEGEYFLLGDNRTGSSDSRAWGPILFSRIVGKAFVQYWPFNRFHWI